MPWLSVLGRGGDEVGRVEDLRQRRDTVVDEHRGAAAQRVRQPLQEAGRRQRPHLGAAAADGDRRVGVRADERDGLQLLPVERQQIAVVLQQHQAGAGGVERHRATLLVVEREAGVDGRAIEPAEANRRAQDPPDLVVDRRRRDLAGLDGGQQRLAVHEFRRRHLEVEARVGGGDAVVGRVPVGHHDAVESPLLLHQAVDQRGVLRHVEAVHQVVRRHERADVRLFDRGLERRQVDLAHRALVDVGAGVVAIDLRVVAQEVLDRGADTLGLHPLDVSDGHPRGEERVLPQVFEVPAAHRGAVDVHARRQHDLDAACARVATDHRADPVGERDVPAGGEADPGGVGGRRADVPDAERPVGHPEGGQPESLHRPDVEVVGAAKIVDLLFQRHLGDERVGSPFDLGGGRGRLGGHGGGSRQEGAHDGDNDGGAAEDDGESPSGNHRRDRSMQVTGIYRATRVR